jgi:hypothetical protein
MDRLAKLLAGLREADDSVSARDAADVLWLARHMTGFQRVAGHIPSPADGESVDDGVPGARPDIDDVEADATPLDIDPKVWFPGPGDPEAHPIGLDALPLRLSDTRELDAWLDLQRALRPLVRTVRAGADLVLDEDMTVQDSADARVVVPTLVRSPQRWLDLALVIDTGPSMVLWDKLITEFSGILTQLGAFRAFRTWYLRFDGKKPGISLGSPEASARSVRELADMRCRQVMLVVTDCVGDQWRNGEAMDVLATWAHTGPLAIVQPLSRRLWSRSAVTCNNVQLLAPYPGAPNHKLAIEPTGRPRASRLIVSPSSPAALEVVEARADEAGNSGGDQSRAGVAIPILEMTPRWLASWARLVCGTSSVNAVVAFSGALPEPVAHDDDPVHIQDPVRLVDRFMAGASPDAVRLAGLLAAAPLSLPLMRHIQREMLPDPRPLQLAEVYLGGLLRSITTYGPGLELRHDLFDFMPGVRSVLLGTIRRSEAKQVMDLVSASRKYSTGEASYSAWVEVPRGTAGSSHLTSVDEFYGTIRAEVLSRMGIEGPRIPDSISDEPTNTASGMTTLVLEPETLESETTATEPEPVAPEVPSEIITRLERGVTLLGTPGSGKTTLLAALGPALTRRHDDWKLVAKDDGSAQTLISMITHLTSQQVFPEATLQIASHHWQLWGENPRPWWQSLFRRPEQVRFDLQVADPSGEIFMDGAHSGLEETLINTLVNSRGIVFLFDPIREFECGDAFEYALHVITRLAQRMIGPDESADGRLPHHIAVCISKFDDKRVFEVAEEMELLTTLPGDPYDFPRVADSDAREFISRLCAVSRNDTTRMAMNLIDRYFHHDRIKYFVTSAIGFYVDRRTGCFSPDDYVNTMPGERAGETRIRGAIHPINVVEPVIWLGGRLAEDAAKGH